LNVWNSWNDGNFLYGWNSGIDWSSSYIQNSYTIEIPLMIGIPCGSGIIGMIDIPVMSGIPGIICIPCIYGILSVIGIPLIIEFLVRVESCE